MTLAFLLPGFVEPWAVFMADGARSAAFLGASAPAAGAATGSDMLTGNLTWTIIKMVLALVAIGLLFWWVVRLTKKGTLGTGGGPQMRILSRVALNRSSTLSLVEVAGRRFVVGAGDSAVSLITEVFPTDADAAELWEEADEVWAAESPARADSNRKAGNEFDAVLRGQVLGGSAKKPPRAARKPRRATKRETVALSLEELGLATTPAAPTPAATSVSTAPAPSPTAGPVPAVTTTAATPPPAPATTPPSATPPAGPNPTAADTVPPASLPVATPPVPMPPQPPSATNVPAKPAGSGFSQRWLSERPY